jgi:rsbT co-antagonist protein RsbR
MVNKNDAFAGTPLMAENIFEQIPTPVMVVDRDLRIVRMNDAGCQFLGKPKEEIVGQHCHRLFGTAHCETERCCMRKAIESGERHTARNTVPKNGATVHIEYTASPLKDSNGKVVGGLEFILDITGKVADEQRLLEQSRTILQMSTPAIKLWDGIVVLPVLGVVDSLRAQQMMDTMLGEIAKNSSRVIIMDIQGVASVDTAVAHHLIKITKATKLMGCECIISGISPGVAQTLVQLGVAMESVHTTATLRDALQEALAQLGHTVTRGK